MNLLIAWFPMCELGLFLLALSLFLLKSRLYTIPEALCLSTLGVHTGLSVLYQSVFLLENPRLAYGIEGIFAMVSILSIIYFRFEFHSFWLAIGKGFRMYPISSIFLLLSWTYLLAQALLIPPDSYDGMKYNLARIFMFQNNESVRLAAATNVLQICAPVGHDILYHIFLRLYTDFGIGFICWLEYFAVGFGVFAIARQFVVSYYARVSAIIVWSLPLVVWQSTSTKNDLILALAGIGCFLSFVRLLHEPRWQDVFWMLVAVGMGISAKINFLAFAIPAMILMGAELISHHGITCWVLILRRKWWLFLLLLIPLYVLSQIWLFRHNGYTWGYWAGEREYITAFQNDDGVRGGFANLIRYFFQSIHLLAITDRIAEGMGWNPVSLTIQNVYQSCFGDRLQNLGAFAPFAMNWKSAELTGWFGPLGFLLLIPSSLFILLRGPRSLRLLSIVLWIYIAFICTEVAWMQYNGRLLTVCFCLFAVSAGYLVSRWDMRRWLARGLVTFSIIQLLYSCVFNATKPLLSEETVVSSLIGMGNSTNAQIGVWERIQKENIWLLTHWGKDRFYYAHQYYRDDRLEILADKIEPQSVVGMLVYSSDFWIYHCFLRRPDVKMQVLDHRILKDGIIKSADLKGLDYLLVMKAELKRIQGMENAPVLWRGQPGFQAGVLVKLLPTESRKTL